MEVFVNNPPKPTSPDMAIGEINHEGGRLKVRRSGDKYFWSIEANTFSKWQEIPASLYFALVEFNGA